MQEDILCVERNMMILIRIVIDIAPHPIRHEDIMEMDVISWHVGLSNLVYYVGYCGFELCD